MQATLDPPAGQPAPGSRAPLRPYQRATVDATVALWERGVLDVLNTIPMGGGKTNVGVELIVEQLDRTVPISQGERALWLCHTEELVQQPYDRLVSLHPAWKREAGIVQAERNDVTARVVFATVQTLRSPKRMRLLLKHGPFKILAIDECHHANAVSYGLVINGLRGANPALRHFGLTATPERGDKDGLRKRYQAVGGAYSIVDMIRAGYLVPFSFQAVQTEVSLRGVKTIRGDFDQGQLARVIDVDNCHKLVVDTHRAHAGDRQAIAFCPSVDGAEHLAAEFRTGGYTAVAVSYRTPKDERRRILADYKAGKIRILCNMAVYTEGLDVPQISCVHWLRMTKNSSLFLQGVGRGGRPSPATGKTDCLVLGYVPIEGHRLVVTGEDILGDPIEIRKGREKAAAKGTVVEHISVSDKGILGQGLHLRTLDLLAGSANDWFHSDGLATLHLGVIDGVERILAITRKADADGLHRLHVVAKKASAAGEATTPSAAGTSASAAEKRILRSSSRRAIKSLLAAAMRARCAAALAGSDSPPARSRKASCSISWGTSRRSSAASSSSAPATPGG